MRIVPKTNQREKHEESKSIDWEQRRYEIAKESLTAIMSNTEFYEQVLDDGKNGGVYSIPINVAMAAVDFADALIEEMEILEQKVYPDRSGFLKDEEKQ